jgi:4-hydroxy-tetrahydrodipicolinate synthase
MRTIPTMSSPSMPFGRLLTAMVTPFTADGAVDLATAADLATYLVDEMDNDALVISGTTGESPTTTDAEKSELLRAVAEAVGDRAQLIAGVGTFATEHTCHLARQAAAAGADGLLVVTPYYSKPPQAGLLAHFAAVADSTELPILLYDIPHRSAAEITTDTMLRLAEHPRIVGVKDAKGNLVESARVLAATDLAYYSGDDAMTLPLMSIGAVGLVGTSTHFTGRLAKQMMQAFAEGRPSDALALHRRLEPTFTGVFATQGVILVKAGLALLGRPVGGLRLPQVAATPQQQQAFAACLQRSGLL